MDDIKSVQLKSWLGAVARHDIQAFRALYGATSSTLFAFALRILGKRELAEEALQESFMNIWNSAIGYQPALAAPMTWMTTIVRNKVFDMLRRADNAIEIDADGFDRSVMDALESKNLTAIESLQVSEDAQALARCLSRLDGTQRQAIALAFYYDLSHSEVAQQMQKPLGTVKAWIRRGLESLRLCLSGLERA